MYYFLCASLPVLELNAPPPLTVAGFDKQAAAELTPGTAFNAAVTLLISLCFGLFAYTCLIGFVTFSEISAARCCPA